MLFRDYLLIINYLILLCPSPSESGYTSLSRRLLRAKILKLDMELVKDVHMKVKSVRHIRRMYRNDMVHQMGEMIYNIRQKYKRMLFLLHYTEKENRHQSVRRLIECQQRSMEIDKLIHMIEVYEWARANTSDARVRVQTILRTNAEKSEKREVLHQEMEKIGGSKPKFVEGQKPKIRKLNFEDGFDTDG